MVSFTSQPVWGEVARCGFIHKETYLRWSYQMWFHPQVNLSEVKLSDVASSTRKPIWGEVTRCGFVHKETCLRWSYQMWFHPQGNLSAVKLSDVASSTRKPVWGEVTGCVSSTSQQISVKQQHNDNILPRGTFSHLSTEWSKSILNSLFTRICKLPRKHIIFSLRILVC
jgi:hypothetical protein